MPYWAVVIIIVVLVVAYYVLTQRGRQQRTERATGDFAKIPDFYANQTYADVHGEVTIGIDDRGRRIAVARKHTQPRARVYSFAHVASAEVLQNGKVIAAIRRGGPAGADGALGAGGRPGTEAQPGANGPPGRASGTELFGSTARPALTGLPVIRPVLGSLTTVGVRVVFQNGAGDEVFVRFYDGKPVNVDGVVGERAFAEAQVFLGSLDIAIKRAGTPPGEPATLKTPVL